MSTTVRVLENKPEKRSGTESRGSGPKNVIFSNGPKSFLSVLIYSTMCKYDSFNLKKKMTGTCLFGGSKVMSWDLVGIIVIFYWVLRWYANYR
jgi:hypothetical protein